MKIVGICPYFSPEYGTYENHLCRAFARRGHVVSLYTSSLRQKRYSYSGGRASEVTSQDPNFTVHYQKALFDLVEMPYLLRVQEKILGIDQDANIFQAFDEFYQLCSVALFRVSRKLQRPFVFIQERYYLPRRAWLRIPFFAWERLCRKVAYQSEAIIVHSNDAARYLQRQRVPVDKIVRVPNGVDFDTFARQATPLDCTRLESKAANILTVARLHPNKGIANLITAMNDITRSFPKTRLTILGRGPEEANLKKLTSDLGLTSSVSFRTDFVDHNEMYRVYSDSDIFVLPSVIEPFGMTALEAMACGRPVVATSTGGIRDVVRNGIDGLLVRPGDSAMLARSLLSLVQNPSLAVSMGKHAVETARKHDWSIIADKMLDIYRELI